ncbi:hypothetical protein ACWF62_01330 [Rhodococcus sp. NPDC054953]
MTLGTIAIAGTVSGCWGGANPVEDIPHAYGSQAEVGGIDLRNVRITPSVEPGTCDLQRDGPSELSFTAVNTGREPDRLVGITSDAAQSVTIEAAPDLLLLAGGSALAAGQPVEQLDTPMAPDEPIHVLMYQLEEWVQPGRSAAVTFVFEVAGSATVEAPIDSCPSGAPR